MADESATAVAEPEVSATPAAPDAKPATGQFDYGDPSDNEGPPQIEHEPARKGTRAAKTARVTPSPVARVTLPPKKTIEVADPDDTEVPEAAETVEPETAATDEGGAEIYESLLRHAEVHGFTKADLDELGEDGLRKLLTAQDRLSTKAIREAEAARQQANGQSRTEPARTEQMKTPAPESAAKTISGFEKYKIDLDPKEFDEQTISALNGLNDHYHDLASKQSATIEELKLALGQVASHFDHVAGRFQAEDHARFSTEMDRFFDSLGDEFRQTFGKGDINSLSPSSAEAKSRIALVDEMRALQFADAQRGRQTSVADLQQRALRLLHSDTLEKQSRTKLAKSVDERRNQSVARPTSRQQAAKTPDEAAVRFARQFLKDHGGETDEAPDEL